MRHDPITAFEHAGLTIEIHADTDADSPRDFDCNVAEIYSFARRSRRSQIGEAAPCEWADRYLWLADEMGLTPPGDLHEWAESTDPQIYDVARAAVLQKAAVLDTEYDGAPVMVVTHFDRYAREVNDDPNGLKDRARENTAAEWRVYRQWLDGECYGYRIMAPDGRPIDEVVGSCLGSCWGFYGMDEVCDEARAEAARIRPDYDAALARESAARQAAEKIAATVPGLKVTEKTPVQREDGGSWVACRMWIPD